MFTPPQISNNDDINYRSFIFFYHNKKRYKFYNGKKLNLDIFPNYAKTIKEKCRLLLKMQEQYHKALLNDWNPSDIEKTETLVTLKTAFTEIITEKLNSPYSRFYKRDLKKLFEQFTEFIPKDLQNGSIKEIPLDIIEKFLNQFKSSGRTYMNKRRSLSIFFSESIRKGYLLTNPVSKTGKQKIKAKLHEIYSEDQLKRLFPYLKENYYNLYLCALITYGCLLRPHQEVRHLQKKHISQDYKKIQLSGSENKSGKLRKVYIPNYLEVELKKRLSGIEDLEVNIFTLGNNSSFNDDYFKTQWSRAKTKLIKIGLIQKNQTLYSFRHTAVVNLYRKTKDLNILQQLLGHSDMIVTLKYLRGLGEATNNELKDHMPELDF